MWDLLIQIPIGAEDMGVGADDLEELDSGDEEGRKRAVYKHLALKKDLLNPL